MFLILDMKDSILWYLRAKRNWRFFFKHAVNELSFFSPDFYVAAQMVFNLSHERKAYITHLGTEIYYMNL